MHCSALVNVDCRRPVAIERPLRCGIALAGDSSGLHDLDVVYDESVVYCMQKRLSLLGQWLLAACRSRTCQRSQSGFLHCSLACADVSNTRSQATQDLKTKEVIQEGTSRYKNGETWSDDGQQR